MPPPINLCPYSVNKGNRELVAECMNQWEARSIKSPLVFSPEAHLSSLLSDPDEEIADWGKVLAQASEFKEEIVRKKLDIIRECGIRANLFCAMHNMTHYLSGSGQTNWFHRDEMRKFKIINIKEEKLKEYILNGIENRRIKEKRYGSYSDHFDASISTYEAYNDGRADFLVAYGASAMKAHADNFNFRLMNGSDDVVEVDGVVRFIFWDIYDFRGPDKSVPIIGKDIFLFYAELHGINGQKARQFNTRAEWTMKFHGEYKKNWILPGGSWSKQEWSDLSFVPGFLTNRTAAEIESTSLDSYRTILAVANREWRDYLEKRGGWSNPFKVPGYYINFLKGDPN